MSALTGVPEFRHVVETNAQPFNLIGEFYEEITAVEGKRQVHICVHG
jgi:hypothetical protein